MGEELMYSRQQETLSLKFSNAVPEITRHDSTIALLPANSIVFSSLPSPGRWLTDKKKYEFVKNNIPDDIIYEKNSDEIIIWVTERENIVFAVVNKSLWLSWRDTLLNVDAIIPEWQLVPCPDTDTYLSQIVWYEYTLVREKKWFGYPVDKNQHDKKHSPKSFLNIETFCIEIATSPLPAEFTYLAKKRKRRSYLYHFLVGFLLTGVILQSQIIYTLRQEYIQSLALTTRVSDRIDDGFTPLLNTLGKINDRLQFKVVTLSYMKNRALITLLSYNDCQKVITELQQDNKNNSIQETQNLKGIWRCKAKLEMTQ